MDSAEYVLSGEYGDPAAVKTAFTGVVEQADPDGRIDLMRVGSASEVTAVATVHGARLVLKSFPYYGCAQVTLDDASPELVAQLPGLLSPALGTIR